MLGNLKLTMIRFKKASKFSLIKIGRLWLSNSSEKTKSGEECSEALMRIASIVELERAESVWGRPCQEFLSRAIIFCHSLSIAIGIIFLRVELTTWSIASSTDWIPNTLPRTKRISWHQFREGQDTPQPSLEQDSITRRNLSKALRREAELLTDLKALFPGQSVHQPKDKL